MPNNQSDGSDRGSRALRPVASSSQRALYVRDISRPPNGVGDIRISPAFLMWVFRQWWMVGVPIGLVLSAAAGAGVLYFHVPRYEAKALLMIEDISPFVAFADRGDRQESQRYIETQLEILRSPVVLEPVLSRPEIASLDELSDQPDRLKALREGLSVAPLGRSELYNISYISPSPEAAAAIVNAVAAEYMVFHADDDSQRSQRVIDILEVERQRRALDVDRLRKRLVDLAEEVTGKDPYGGTVTDVQRALNPLGSLFESLTDAEAEREELKAQLQFLTESHPLVKDSFESSRLLDLGVDNLPEVAEKQATIKAIKAEMEQIKNDVIKEVKNPRWEDRPTYVKLKKELQQREQELIEFKSEQRETILVQRREERKFEREQDIAKTRRQLELLDRRHELLSKRFADQLNELQTGEGKSVELEFARAELAREEKVFELIASRKLALQTEMRAPARIQLTRKADVPTMPIEPVPYKILFVVCSAVFLRHLDWRWPRRSWFAGSATWTSSPKNRGSACSEKLPNCLSVTWRSAPGK